jgi:cathepsin L
MYKFLQVLVGLFAVTSTVTAEVSTSETSIHFPRFWEWMSTHSIVPNSVNHVDHMFNNWVNNDVFINEVNNQDLPYKLAHNAYSGMNFDEFREYMGLNNDFVQPVFRLRGNNEMVLRGDEELSALPTSIDWRSQGVVTPVKDQGQCGSCFSFSNTGALEGAYALKYGTLKSFSEQEIVDCSTLKNGGPNMGCNGGQIGATMDWIGRNGGLCTEAAYPYTSGTTKVAGTCQRSSCTAVSGSQVVSHTNVAVNSDIAMMTALTKQPVSIAVEADQAAFQFYSSGVFTQTCGTNLDHAVLLVGYGTLNGVDHYILKNSWGSSWGSQGYMYIGRGTQYNGGKGQCGLLMEGAYPNL